MRAAFRRLVAAVACLAPAAVFAAGTPSPITSEYRITTWAAGDGITLGDVLSIAQDRDGYLWLASGAGLVRFDGLRFMRDDLVAGPTRLPLLPTAAVYAARDGTLWVGYQDGEGVYRIRDGEVRDIYLRGRTRGRVNIIVEDRHGGLWVGHDEGLLRMHGGVWAPVDLPPAHRGVRVLDVHEGRAGTVWVATESGLLTGTSAHDLHDAPHAGGAARSISEDRSGRLWTTDEVVGFRRADAPHDESLIEGRGRGLFHDSRGNLWVTTRGQGLWQVGNGPAATAVKRATVETGLLSDESSAIFEDRDGNIWIGSIQGLNRLTPHRVLSLVDVGVVQSLAFTGTRKALVGTATGLLELTGVGPQSPGDRRMVSSAAVRMLHTARDGRVWVATGEGLHQVLPGGLQPIAAGRSLRHVTSMASDNRGTLWICDEQHGVVRLDHGRLERVEPFTAGLAAEPVLVYVDKTDRVWIAFRGGVVRRMDAGRQVREWGAQEGLTHSVVYTLHHDRRGQLWVGGNRGLSRLNGDRFETRVLYNEVPGRSVTGIVDDEDGLWVGLAFFGFIRLDYDDALRATADASYRPSYRVYTSSSGAGNPPNVAFGNTGHMDRNGALWFITTRGLAVADPAALRSGHGGAPGRPRIEGVTADDHHYRAVAGLVLPPRTSRLRIDYTSVSLSSLDRLRFRYRLDGFDTNWVDGTGPRQALYTNLPPGTYRFQVQASNNEAEWNEAAVEWSFAMAPMFYQTRWFYALCALGLVMCAMGAWQLRVRRVHKELALVFSERLRLSREIHDTLLQSLYGVALQLDVATRHLQDSASPVRAHLLRLRRQTEEYISEARQSIWNLRSHALDERDLVTALRDTADRLTAGKVPFVLRVTGTPRRYPTRLETQVLRIGHEAVMNAVRHANAQHLEMEIGFDDDRLRLLVADDGRGFAIPGQDDDRGQHYGLLSMQERAADAGGRCTITTAPGAGVQVIAEFPLTPAA